METVYTRVCDVCGKEIKSLYEKQADYNLRAHKAKHETNEQHPKKTTV